MRHGAGQGDGELLQKVGVSFRHRHAWAKSRQNRIVTLDNPHEFRRIQQIPLLDGDSVPKRLESIG
jgi:hypothetical protein